MKKQLTAKDLIPILHKADAIVEVCNGKYINTHTIFSAEEDGICLCGSEHHAEDITVIPFHNPITVVEHDPNSLRVEDSQNNDLLLTFYTHKPLPILKNIK